MLTVGLTGGLACGKSFVGRELERLGCVRIEADALGHEVLGPGGAAAEAVVREFGPEILGEDGAIDRRMLAGRVFGSAERLERLNAIVHPPVKRREEELTRAARERDPHAIIVYEAAILIETGSYRSYDRLIVVVCREEDQVERAMARGATLEEVQSRLARQMPLTEKRKYADYVIDTSGAREETLRQTGEVFAALRRIAEGSGR